MTGSDQKEKFQRDLIRAFEKTKDGAFMAAALKLGPIRKDLIASKVGRPKNVDASRVIYMGMLIKREPELSIAAAAKKAFPDDPEVVRKRYNAGLDSKRKTLAREYSKIKDEDFFKLIVAICLDLDAHSSLAGRADDTAPFLPLRGVLEVLQKRGFAELVPALDGIKF